MPADADWELPAADNPGFTPMEQRAAIATACQALDVIQVGDVRSSILRKSIGLRVRGRDDAESWVKISGADTQPDEWARQGELTANSISGVHKPSILREIEWNADGKSWYALQLTLAPSPAVCETPWIAGPSRMIDDRWLGELKHAIDRVSELPLTRWLVHPGRVARVIGERFGGKAPQAIDEWRTAHGDMNWSNLTAPNLMLLDWERWGAAPRGFDAATLLAFSFRDPALFRRIEAMFAHDLDTPTGVVARLYQYARRLIKIEAGIRDPRDHRTIETEAKRLLRL
jgi:hypothetical protein